MTKVRIRFSPKNQARDAVKAMNLASIGTQRNYEQALLGAAKFARTEKLKGLNNISKEDALRYLEIRSKDVSQKTLDLDRQALQQHLRITGKLAENERLTVIKSEKITKLTSRNYTKEQVIAISNAQSQKNALATQIVAATGLRAHELLTLRCANERKADDRPVNKEKFAGLSGERYTVHGKGGLIREVIIPHDLAEKLEATRLSEPKAVLSEKIFYKSFYDVGGGNSWSASFSKASKSVLGWSHGGHGLRHAYAQDRMRELQRNQRLTYEKALETVAQEVGHFDAQTTLAYLR